MRAASAQGLPVTTTEPFNPQRVLMHARYSYYPNFEEGKIPPLPIDSASAKMLARAAENLLVPPASISGPHPLALVELYPDATVVVIQLNQVTAEWDDKTVGSEQLMIAQQMNGNDGEELVSHFCDYPNVAARLNYQPKGR
jgi:hypothetical protein